MKFYLVSSRLARSLVALAVSAAMVLSTFALALASPSRSTTVGFKNSTPSPTQSKPSSVELQLTTTNASATAAGVTLHWTTSATADNVGFNVYRIANGQRTRVNREIIPGAMFASARPDLMRGGYSYAWFDAKGTVDSTYVIESVNAAGVARSHASIRPILSKLPQDKVQSASSSSEADNESAFERTYLAADSTRPNVVNGPLEDQWMVAGQTALKIAIKKDGWYRVTQPQMATAGFNPTVDIRNLRLFEGGNEVAISTSQFIGLFGAGDYIEFYGRGLSTPQRVR